MQLRAALPEFLASACPAEVFSVENKALVVCGLRSNKDSKLDLFSVINVSGKDQLLEKHPFPSQRYSDLISGKTSDGALLMKPYQVSWLRSHD